MKKFALVLFSVFLVLSCKKNQLGGSATISGTVKHHTKAISGARVFVKFNAKEFPGKDTSVYDARIVSDAEGKFSVKCYKGHYFLYGLGYDAGVPGKVSGGVAVNVRTKENLQQDVPVTED